MDTNATSVPSRRYRVSGMTCEHCAGAVEAEVAEAGYEAVVA